MYLLVRISQHEFHKTNLFQNSLSERLHAQSTTITYAIDYYSSWREYIHHAHPLPGRFQSDRI